jgi:hypothetical protein
LIKQPIEDDIKQIFSLKIIVNRLGCASRFMFKASVSLYLTCLISSKFFAITKEIFLPCFTWCFYFRRFFRFFSVQCSKGAEMELKKEKGQPEIFLMCVWVKHISKALSDLITSMWYILRHPPLNIFFSFFLQYFTFYPFGRRWTT